MIPKSIFPPRGGGAINLGVQCSSEGSVFLRAGDLLIQINAFNEIARKPGARLSFACALLGPARRPTLVPLVFAVHLLASPFSVLFVP